MAPALPLTRWRLSGAALPARLLEEARPAPFSLPGAQALGDFAALLEGEDGAASSGGVRPPQSGAAPGAPFQLPALLPQDMPGAATLSRELRLGGLGGESATLQIGLLLGSGGVYLDGERVAAFRSGPFALDLTRALLSGRAHTLAFRFDGARPAGMLGGVLLRATLLPDAASGTMTVRAAVRGLQAGTYLLRAAPFPARGEAAPSVPREVTLSLAKGEMRVTTLTLCVPGERFVPGQPYDMPGVKLSLWRLRPALRPAAPRHGFWRRRDASPAAAPRLRPGALCDAVTLAGGYPGDAPRAFLPLRAAECAAPPDALVSRIRALHLPAVYRPVPASDPLALALPRAGIPALQRTPRADPARERLARFPCLTLADRPGRARDASGNAPESALENASENAFLEVSAWRLSSMTGAPRSLEPGLTPADLLFELTGGELDPAAPGTRAVLAWLRALSVRLRAEAARQGRADGPLCAPGEWDTPDIADALATAFAPLHLSALPQRGAWWTHSRFSASLRAFVPAGTVPEDAAEALLAEAVLETEEGELLARLCAPCPRSGGEIGVLESTLPASPCVLTLSARLLLGDTVLEQSALPVYVGERGVLEAAFAR